MSKFVITREDDYLVHHGVKGQKWGVRRYQNEDGSLTAEGMKQRAKIEKWYGSSAGKRERNAFSNRGMSAYDAYKSHRTAKAGAIGWFVGGIAGGAIGAVVSNKRTNAGKEFFQKEIARLEGESIDKALKEVDPEYYYKHVHASEG